MKNKNKKKLLELAHKVKQMELIVKYEKLKNEYNSIKGIRNTIGF